MWLVLIINCNLVADDDIGFVRKLYQGTNTLAPNEFHLHSKILLQCSSILSCKLGNFAVSVSPAHHLANLATLHTLFSPAHHHTVLVWAPPRHLADTGLVCAPPVTAAWHCSRVHTTDYLVSCAHHAICGNAVDTGLACAPPIVHLVSPEHPYYILIYIVISVNNLELLSISSNLSFYCITYCTKRNKRKVFFLHTI